MCSYVAVFPHVSVFMCPCALMCCNPTYVCVLHLVMCFSVYVILCTGSVVSLDVLVVSFSHSTHFALRLKA